MSCSDEVKGALTVYLVDLLYLLTEMKLCNGYEMFMTIRLETLFSYYDILPI